MDNVYDITPDFDFNQILLESPTPLHGGSYYTKLSIAKGCKNLYIQLPKVTSKQGIMKNSSKVYCDLMFPSGNKEVISWFEQLEKRCQDLIIQKKELWFHNTVSDTDIDEMMNPIIRPYKSGKYFLVRSYLKGGKCNVFDENEQIYDLENLTNNDEIIPLINLDGIRFNAKNIQIEITLTQLMVLIPAQEFEKKCLIKLHKYNNLEINNNLLKENLEDIRNKEDNLEKDNEREVNFEKDNEEEANLEKDNEDKVNLEKHNQEEINLEKQKNYKKEDLENGKSELQEVELEITDIVNNEVISLRDPKEVYKEIYMAARKKAYELRKNALDAYLEAQNIKEKYSFEDMDDSENEEEELNNLFKK
tara:strand:- start:408 stop:1493 length:1086 start_codon:yes stop_codon:yes gene_type:complete